MSLISKETAIEALEFERDTNETPERIKGVEDAIEAIQYLSSVPAVPLDKLCDLLSGGAYPCTILSGTLCPFEECITTSRRYSKNISKDCWKAVLEKWMEKNNAAD